MHRIIKLIEADPFRLNALKLVAGLELPQAYIAAGFIRNLVWDHLHGFRPTPLNDLDVIIYSHDKNDEIKTFERLKNIAPHLNWQVKNQADMHLKNGDEPYQNIIHAMTYWPEMETAFAARLDENKNIEIVSPFVADLLFAGSITHNSKREEAIFLSRVKEKEWLIKWPSLTIKFESAEI